MKNRLLLHICCAPCLTFPLADLQRSCDLEISGYFFNNNIHPYQEFLSRMEAVSDYTAKMELPLILESDYLLEEFLAAVAAKPAERCRFCYHSRLEKTARIAAEKGFDHFSTTLLYSVYQKHELIVKMGNELGEKYGIRFLYRDWRQGWNEGRRLAGRDVIYRQKYCGCIYSEYEALSARRKKAAAKKSA